MDKMMKKMGGEAISSVGTILEQVLENLEKQTDVLEGIAEDIKEIRESMDKGLRIQK